MRVSDLCANKMPFTKDKDYFFYVAKPMLYVDLLHGLFPFKLKKVGDFTELRADLISFNFFYAISYYGLVCYTFTNFHERVKSPLYLSNVVWPIIMLVLYWIKTKQCISSFALINKFDAKMPYGEEFLETCVKRRQFWLFWCIILYIYTLIVYLGLYQDVFDDFDIPTWSLVLCFVSFFLLRMPRILFGFTFVMMSDEIVRRFRFVRQSLTMRVRDKSKGNLTEDDLMILEEMRMDYFVLVKSTELMANFFGDGLLIVLCQNLFETFHLCYKIIILTESIKIPVVLHYLYDYYMIHSMTTAAENLIKASKSIVKDLRCLPLQYLPDSWLNQIEIMSVQIQAIPLVISASGYFNIDRSLLLSVLTSIVMYLIILIQLAPIVKKIEEEAAEVQSK